MGEHGLGIKVFTGHAHKGFAKLVTQHLVVSLFLSFYFLVLHVCIRETSSISVNTVEANTLPPPHLDSLLRGHLPLVHLVGFVPHEDLLDFLRGVLQ